MGSFNETCMVSGLPIAWRDPCRMFVLRPHWYLPTHYQSEWEPLVVVPLKGTYDDYGRLGDLDLTPAFRLQHKMLLRTAREVDEEARKRHWEVLKRYPDDPSALYELCERGVLNVRTPHGDRVTAPAYVREDVYQLVLDRTRKAKNWNGPFLEQAEKMIAARFKHRELSEESMGMYVPDAPPEVVARRKELMDQTVRLEDEDYGYGRHEGRMLLIDPWDEIKADPELRASLEEAMVEFELFSTGIAAVNVSWQPRTARGQDSDYEYHAAWHREIAALADEAHRRREEEE